MYAEQRLGRAVPTAGVTNSTLSAPPTQVGEIGVQARGIESQIDRLNKAIGLAISRLEPILGGPRESGLGSDCQQPCATEMGSFLACQNDRLETAIAQLHSLTDRVEL